MYIKSNIEISEGSVKEFVRVLIPEAVDKNIMIHYETTAEKIVVKLEIDGKIAEYIYSNYEDKIGDQKIVLAKTSILKIYDKNYSWGGLIGVRPTKVVKRLLLLGYTEEKVIHILEEIYLVSQEKAELLLKIFLKEKTLMNREAYNIYIGIPFCPSKCRYCSFASFELGSPVGERYYAPFVETLLEEIKLTGELIRVNAHKIESIYIGGGTPSTLTEKDLERVLKAIDLYIDKSKLKEFTFEAGREDSITEKKLELAKKYGVDRVSLNPQTFKLETLENLNRKFNRENFDRCYKKIKELGFILNMDLILGLPGETEADILKTLQEVKKYDMENLTIHSLALKKASTLFKDEDGKITDLERGHIELGIKNLIAEKKLEPYYMYRQKNSAHWGENIGYSKEGFESIFNIEMI
ncbi:MAG: coproporphyrinogen dehydrogenase HemZ, partial [Fusobacteriaceae bacterium]